MKVRTARANPGGEIAPDEVFGRDGLITRFWRTLEVQSIVLVAERRIGKTTLVKKMRSNVPTAMRLVYRDVEGIRSPLEFAEAVAKDVELFLSLKARGATKLKVLFSHLAGAEVGGVLKFPASLAPHWKALLEATLDDLLRSEPEITYVFVWDELPVMIDKILRSEGEATAMDVLDTLRGLRQGHSKLRMIYTGSIGLHHVLSKLQASAHLNDTTNDMRSMEVGELSSEDGARLAKALMEGEQITHDAETPELVSDRVDHVPFYIHHVVRMLSEAGSRVNAALVERIVASALVDPQDPWHLEHFLVRLDERYGEERAALARVVLEVIAASDRELSVSEVSQLLRSTIKTTAPPVLVAAVLNGDDGPLLDLVKLLARDHYIAPNSEKRYQFRFSLVRRWWNLQGANR